MLWTTTAATERTTVAEEPTRSRAPCEHHRIGSEVSQIRRRGEPGKSKVGRSLQLGCKSSVKAENPVSSSASPCAPLRATLLPTLPSVYDTELACKVSKGSNVATIYIDLSGR
jgi:hypothetical protein